MKKMMMVAALAVPAAPALAQSAFDGTWKADLSSVQMPTKPDVMLLQNGTYTCSSCVPAYSVKADGAFHAVADHPYFDMESVKIVDDRSVMFSQKKAGKIVSTATNSISRDGKTLSYTFTDSSNASGPPVTGNGTETRTEDGPAGSHAISGSWQPASYDNVSDNGLMVTFKTTGDMLHMSSPTGQSYDARFGGGDVPIKGDKAGTTASVVKLADGSIQETDKRDGKVVSVYTMAISADGKTMNATSEDKVQGTTMSYKATKQ